jgi:uncharacterized PurR-regulated membrane protein YhhQ (DUF165 family)
LGEIPPARLFVDALIGPFRGPDVITKGPSIIVDRAIQVDKVNPSSGKHEFTSRQFLIPVAAMALVVVLSNFAVQFPINDWLTWGAFTYPVVFLVTDLTNRALGPAAARRVAWVGFAVAVVASLAVAPWRIAVASGCAFILAQWLDISAFNRLRQASWWQAPLIGSLLASVIDTAVFFFLAFYGSEMNWLTLAAGDIAVKWAMALLLLAPYRALMPHVAVWRPTVS